MLNNVIDIEIDYSTEYDECAIGRNSKRKWVGMNLTYKDIEEKLSFAK